MSATAAREYCEAVPLPMLDLPELDARIARDPDELARLAQDIARRGVILPLIVFRKADRFEIVDGTCRLLGSAMAGKTTVPCLVYPDKDLALEGMKYAANIFRLEMSPAEEAIYFNQLYERECAHDVDRVCALVNQSRPYVDNRLALILGHEEVFEAVRAKQIKLGVAAELNKIPDLEYVHYYLTHAVHGGATVSTVAGWVQEYLISHGDLPKRPADFIAAGASAPGVTTDPNQCLVCGKSNNAHAIRWVPVHTHCQLAILEPTLAAYRGEASSIP
jgi:ParB/RepB/Spo0J family partition protein